MKKLTLHLATFLLFVSFTSTYAQWSKSYNDPAINGIPSDDVAYDVEMESNGTSYVAGVINGGLNSQDIRLMKYSSTGVQLGTFTHSTPAHKETVRFMVTGTDNNLYVITNADEVGNNLSYIKVMKYSKSMQFLNAMTYSNPIYYVPTAATVDAAGSLFISCTRKNPMGGTGELAILKVGQNLMIQSVYAYSFQFPGDGYHVNAEAIFAEAGAVYVGGHIIQGGASSARTLLIKINSSTMTSQFIKIGTLSPGRNSFSSLFVTDKYVYVTGTINGSTPTSQRFHKFTGLLEATYNYTNLGGQTNEGRKVTKINGAYYLALTTTNIGVTDLKLYKIDASTLQPLSASTQTFNVPILFNDMLITQDMVLATGGVISNGDWKMFMSTLKVGGLSTLSINPAMKSTGIAVTKRSGGFIAVGWQDKTIAPALPDNEFITQYIADAAISRIEGFETATNAISPLVIYPVSATDQIIVKGLSPSSDVVVLDMQGGVVLNSSSNTSGEILLKVQQLLCGVYFVKNANGYAKFVKQ